MASQVLCLLGPPHGLAGALLAWAIPWPPSQYVGALLMLRSLHTLGRIRLAISPPPLPALLNFLSLTGPIFVSLASKVSFYMLLTFQATSLGTLPLAAHQVIFGVFCLCAGCGEPLSQTAQSFLPRLCVGVNRNMQKARRLLLALTLVAALLGAVEAAAALLISLCMPSLFTADPAVVAQIVRISPALAVSLVLNPIVLSSEGALLASRDVAYMASTMTVAMLIGALLLRAAQHWGLSLAGNWWILVLFNSMRLTAAAMRLTSRQGIFSKGGLPQPMHA
ncbi:hypothetical protein CLOM_g6244 [Closterium sp. NIES-68]|nr:hypothetical protein CLOM_g6244 [Closterium sp. NIES-68]